MITFSDSNWLLARDRSPVKSRSRFTKNCADGFRRNFSPAEERWTSSVWHRWIPAGKSLATRSLHSSKIDRDKINYFLFFLNSDKDTSSGCFLCRKPPRLSVRLERTRTGNAWAKLAPPRALCPCSTSRRQILLAAWRSCPLTPVLPVLLLLRLHTCQQETLIQNKDTWTWVSAARRISKPVTWNYSEQNWDRVKEAEYFFIPGLFLTGKIDYLQTRI